MPGIADVEARAVVLVDENGSAGLDDVELEDSELGMLVTEPLPTTMAVDVGIVVLVNENGGAKLDDAELKDPELITRLELELGTEGVIVWYTVVVVVELFSTVTVELL